MKYLTKGKRGIIHLEKKKGKTLIVKTKRPESKVLNTLGNEARWLKMLNRKGIGPTFHSYRNGELRMEYIRGTPIIDWLEHHNTNQTLVRTVLTDVLVQCFLMDQLRVEKKEMHNPYKHILIRRSKPVLLDFERCKQTLKPGNVTQFCHYLAKLGYLDRTATLPLLQQYKKTYNLKKFKKLLSLLR